MLRFIARVSHMQPVKDGYEVTLDTPHIQPTGIIKRDRGMINHHPIRDIYTTTSGRVICLLDQPITTLYALVRLWAKPRQRSIRQRTAALLTRYALRDVLQMPLYPGYTHTSPDWITVHLLVDYLAPDEVQAAESAVNAIIRDNARIKPYISDYEDKRGCVTERAGELGEVRMIPQKNASRRAYDIHLQIGDTAPSTPMGHQAAFRGLHYSPPATATPQAAAPEVPDAELDALSKRQIRLRDNAPYHLLSALLPDHPRPHLRYKARHTTTRQNIVTLASPVPDSTDMSSFVVSVGQELQHPVIGEIVEELVSEHKGQHMPESSVNNLIEVTRFAQDALDSVLDTFTVEFIRQHPLFGD